MVPKTALSNACLGANYAPIYLNKCALIKDPLERMKYIVTFKCVLNYHGDNGRSYFLKPVIH